MSEVVVFSGQHPKGDEYQPFVAKGRNGWFRLGSARIWALGSDDKTFPKRVCLDVVSPLDKGEPPITVYMPLEFARDLGQQLVAAAGGNDLAL